MRHSFRPAPPADLSPKVSAKNQQEKTQHDSGTKMEAGKKKPQARAENTSGHAAHEKRPVTNGMNGHSRGQQLGGNSWKAVTEEALRKLQGSMSTDARPSSAVSSASVTGLSRSASFASLDSQSHLEGTAHKGRAQTASLPRLYHM